MPSPDPFSRSYIISKTTIATDEKCPRQWWFSVFFRFIRPDRPCGWCRSPAALRPLSGDMLLPGEPGKVQYAPHQAVAHGVVHGHHQAFRHGQVAEQTDILKGPGDAGPIHLGCGHAVGVLAVQHNGARCGLVYLFSKNAFSFVAAEAAAASPRRGGRQEENGKHVYFSL